MKKFLAVVILFSFFLLPFFNVYGVHMLTHDIQRLSPNALWGIVFLFFSNIIWTTLVITIVTRAKILRNGILTATTYCIPIILLTLLYFGYAKPIQILFLSHLETSIFSFAFVIGILISLRILSKKWSTLYYYNLNHQLKCLTAVGHVLLLHPFSTYIMLSTTLLPLPS